MLEVLGQGILLQGESRIGKSDLALGLVDRGHRLVADDLVEFVSQGEVLYARCRCGFEGFLEVSGLGIVNLAKLYGEQAVVSQAPLNLVLSLEKSPSENYDYLQPVEIDWHALGISVPAWRLPYIEHRNMPLIVETAARLNHALQQGYDASADFHSRLACLLTEGAV